MCEYHFKGNCFHPNLVEHKIIAKTCDVQTCEACTNKKWQQEQINKEISFYIEELQMHKQETTNLNLNANEVAKITSIAGNIY